MFEFLAFMTMGMLAFGLLALAVKAVFALILLPLKLGVWMFKGVLGLILVVPAVIIAVCLATSVLPILVGVIAIPVLACIGILTILCA